LQLINQFGVSYAVDNIDINACIETNIFVCNVSNNSSAVSESCAEHCIFLAIACLRKFKECQNSIISNKLFTPTGRTLYKSNCMIFGFGDIGRMLVNRLKSFEVNKIFIINVSKNANNEQKNELDQEYDIGNIEDFPKLAPHIDILFICCSDKECTNGFVNKRFLSYLKTGVILINISRGALLNYGDCLDGIESNQIGSIGLDTFYTEPFPISDPLLLHPSVIVTPHIASTTVLASNEIPSYIANNVRRMRQGKKPLGIINSND
jgi:lactate dehydrogenase-like 2-hydroxyacid dehydrogenase